ncbi:MAG: trypsin-like peptidase domain-containing protein [Planctomycetota bacterium]
MRRLTEYGPSLIVLLTALMVLFVGPNAVRALQYARTSAAIVEASERLEGPDNILAQINQASRDIATAVEPSVVHISVTQNVSSQFRNRPSLAFSSGSGWIYDEAGHIVTNYHVVENAEEIEVQLHTGELREAEVVGYDEFTDIAVIKINPGRLSGSRLGDLDSTVQQGDLVYAFGSPFDFRFSMSQGVVSGKGRSVGVIRGRGGYENFIQVDAAINPGNSGGPLTNFEGRVIGMNTAIATGPRRDNGLEEGQFAGIGLAIPLRMIVPVVDQLINDGVVRKGYLGLRPSNIGPSMSGQLQAQGFIGKGVRVESVEPDSPAERGGLRRDDIITHIGRDRVSSTDQLRSVISSTLPGESIKIEVWRYDTTIKMGRTISLDVVLETLSTLRVLGRIPEDQPQDRLEELGIERMATASRRLATQAKVPFVAGVIIRELTSDNRYGDDIVPGAIITEVAGVPVKTTNDLLTQLRQYNLLTPRFGRGGVTVTVVKPDGTTAKPTLYVD